MDNMEAAAYAVVALESLKKHNKKVDKETLGSEMMYLMDVYSEEEILEKVDEC